MQILQNVLHSLTKRKKQAGKVTVTAAVAAVFIAAIVVSANGILSYQKAVTKKTFGGWFIMENSSNGTQSEELKTHPYLAGWNFLYIKKIIAQTDKLLYSSSK